MLSSQKTSNAVETFAGSQEAEDVADDDPRDWYFSFGALWAPQLRSSSSASSAHMEMFLVAC